MQLNDRWIVAYLFALKVFGILGLLFNIYGFYVVYISASFEMRKSRNYVFVFQVVFAEFPSFQLLNMVHDMLFSFGFQPVLALPIAGVFFCGPFATMLQIPPATTLVSVT